jgi:hypothetical protein
MNFSVGPQGCQCRRPGQGHGGYVGLHRHEGGWGKRVSVERHTAVYTTAILWEHKQIHRQHSGMTTGGTGVGYE